MFTRLLVMVMILAMLGCNGKSSENSNQNTNNETTIATEPNRGSIPPVSGINPQTETEPTANPVDSKLVPVQFADITRTAGINFKHTSGAFGQKYLPETMGAGCAFLDFDNDGWQDILLINSKHWPGQKGRKVTQALYHNNKDGTFSDVTRAAGLDIEMYGLGSAIADYDNDGYVDIFLSGLGPDYLLRNRGNGTFEDVTARAGVDNPDFSTGAAWFDYNKDGLLDLFVCNYVEWSIEKDLHCTLDGKTKSYCKPESYKGQTSRLYHNRGNSQFEDVTEKAGLLDPTCKALGIAVVDYDRDSWPDLFVTNDTEPNKLYHNEGNGIFTEQGVTAGIAFSESGVARAGMGTDFADYDGSGYPSLIVGNFSNEMFGLYHNEGKGLFIDEAPTSNIGQATLLSLTFACFFYDYDLDGYEDIFLANGHVADDINRVQPKITYAQSPKLFRNLGKKRFDEMSRRVGVAFQQPMVARGSAYADYDNDGDLDLLITTNNGSARLLRNEGGNQHHSLRIRTVGTKSNRDGIGATVTIRLADSTTQWRVVKSGSSYCSQSELPITFGLGKQDRVAAIEVKWPSGLVDRIVDINADQIITIKEGSGLDGAIPLAGKLAQQQLSLQQLVH
ncbi:MAG: CRTAC1 family protein [Acidobacteriota bacterium]